MAPVLRTTRIFVSVLWIAAVFNAFRGCLLESLISHPNNLPFRFSSNYDNITTSHSPATTQAQHAGRTGANTIAVYPRTYISTRSQGAFAATL
jgi:hypothetical protein